MELLLKICVVLIVGVGAGRLVQFFKLPNVTGYLLAGLFLGPSFLTYIDAMDIDSFSLISEFALAIIAFTMGSGIIIKDMLKLGKSIVIITIAQAFFSIATVFLVMYFLFDQSFAFSIVIAAISASTSPAGILMVLKQYNAYGPLSQTILPTVALSNILVIFGFGIAMSLARFYVSAQSFSLLNMLLGTGLEFLVSIILGLLLGFLLSYVSKRSKGRDELQAITLGTIGITTGLANILNLSPLLTCIVMGITLVNTFQKSKPVFSALNDFSSPIYVLFFALAGASLDLGAFAEVGLIGITFVLARAFGKIVGGWIGTKAVNAEEAITKNLGLSLLPQGGIAIGLIVLVRQQLPEYAVTISSIVMFSILIYEMTGPIFAKIAIQRAGEIDGFAKITPGKMK